MFSKRKQNRWNVSDLASNAHGDYFYFDTKAEAQSFVNYVNSLPREESQWVAGPVIYDETLGKYKVQITSDTY